ncbi:hypothetical protein BWI97_13920 [Siphonobacter sp. BAB-5405]|nr:hypothetical protein BWI97_13920 [Siphonobacter sp. BAB-5405]
MRLLYTYGIRLIALLCCLLPFRLSAQQISQLEYFVDKDPGFGKAAPVSITASQDITANFSVDVKNLSTGFHTLYVRSKVKPYQVNEGAVTVTKGGWSLTQTRVFYKETFDTPALTSAKIIQGEYFIDVDPSFGKGKNVSITSVADSSRTSLTFDLTTLPSGFHRLYVRFKDNKGHWSLTQMRTFYKENVSLESSTLVPLVAGEYFIDQDPGFGQGKSISFTRGIDINNVSLICDLSGLSPGFHRLYTRFKNATGHWGQTANRTFYKDVSLAPTSTLPKILQGEYFVDVDPGFGKAKVISLPGGTTSTSVDFAVDVSSLSSGVHQLYTRIKNENGSWSQTNVRSFYKQDFPQTQPPSEITQVEYFLDQDPGFGKGKQLAFTPATTIDALVFEIDAQNLALGDHMLYVRAKNKQGQWGITNRSTFRVEPPTGVFVTMGVLETVLCIGKQVSIPFTVNSPFSEGNVFTAQLSDAKGDFSSPQNLGTFRSTSSGTIVGTIPYSMPPGSNYRIRITSSNPVRISTVNSIPLSISRVPSVFSVTGDTVSCIGVKTYALKNADATAGLYKWSLSGGGSLQSNGTTSTIQWATPGLHTIRVNYTGVCAGSDSMKTLAVNVFNESLTGSFQNLLPQDNETNLSMPVAFTWSPIAKATLYDLYIWPKNSSKPTVPTIANISTINHVVSDTNLIRNNQTYQWQVVAKRDCKELTSPVRSFQTSQLPDLVVESMSAPTTAISETELTVNWTIKNQGKGGTSSSWFDEVYLCDQPDLDKSTQKFLMGRVANLTALSAGQSYRAVNLSFKIPQAVQGDYYIIVTANATRSIRESSLTNNQKISSTLKISLAPPPDLQVTAVTVSPLNAFSGGEVTLVYTVSNKGTGPTTATSWTDQVFISKEQTVNVTTDKILYTYSRQGSLNKEGSYQVTQRLKLPLDLSGLYYVHVVTDRYNGVFEYNREDNNSLSSLAMTIIQRPNPNLVVNNVGSSVTQASAGQTITVNWTTANDGALTAIPSWADGVYLSSEQTFNATSARLISQLTRRDSLFSLSSVQTQQNVQIPLNLKEGDYYLFVVADLYKQVYENTDESDNIALATGKIKVLNPDLKPESLSSPSTAASETTIALQWKVKNESAATLYTGQWIDRIYLSKDQTFDPASDVLLVENPSNQLLDPGGEYTKNASAILPPYLSGTYYLILVSDATNTIFERIETNNLVTAPLTLTLSSWADLEVTTLVTPSVDTLGTPITIRYTVRNNGAGALLNKSWTDAIYLSPTPVLNESTRVLLGTTHQSRSLTSGQSYNQQTGFSSPSNLPAGSYYIAVRSDIDQVIFENGSKANNEKLASTPTKLVTLPATDLAVSTASILNSTVIAGQTVNVQWSVKNNSASPTAVPTWSDAVYLSTNATWDASDALLGSIAVISPLTPGSSYTSNLTVTLPQDISGNVFFIVVTDRQQQLADPNRSNNSQTMRLANGNTSIPVVTPPPVDLVPTLLAPPANAIAAQPLTIRYKVKNNGLGSTPAQTWIDQFYLSTDTQLGTNDLLLGSRSHSATLAAGTEYIDTLQFIIPANVNGNYYLLFKTDATNAVFERGNENNNVVHANLFINQQQPSDLIVKDVTLPSGQSFAGEKIAIRWTLNNIGTNASKGILREAVYISQDGIWDATDVLLGTLESVINLSAQASTVHTLEKPLANLPTGQYYAIVKTDILNTIVEQNETNNQAVSTNTFAVSVKELRLNTLTAATLPATAPLYYRVEIPASLAGETLALTLKGDSTKGAINRLFIRQGSMPTVNQYEYSGATPFLANQELIIPSLEAGTYYLLVTGGYSTAQNQPVSLFARIIPFGIKTVDANQGGNTGLATLKITGARFDSHTSFRLRKGGSESITAYRIQYIDQTLVYVTFNLLNKPLGLYDVEAVQAGGTTAVLPKSFTITQGTGNLFTSTNAGTTVGSGFVCSITNVGFEDQFETELLTPASVRFAAVTSFIVSYQNNGSVDIPVPTKYLLSLNENNPVAFSVDQLKANNSELVLEFKEEGGPPGILRPGAKGFFKVYTVSNNRTIPSIDIVITD